MHEMSLVRSLLRQVAEIVADEGGGVVRTIRLQCGPLAGVEPAMLHSAFEQLKTLGAIDNNQFSNATLQIDHIPLELECRDCRALFQPPGFRFVCATCGSGDTEVIRGDGLWIESIELESHAGEPA